MRKKLKNMLKINKRSDTINDRCSAAHFAPQSETKCISEKKSEIMVYCR